MIMRMISGIVNSDNIDATQPAGERAQAPEYSEKWRVAQDYSGRVLIVRHDGSNQEAPIITLSNSNSDAELAHFIVNQHNTYASNQRVIGELTEALNDAKETSFDMTWNRRVKDRVLERLNQLT